MKKCPKCNSNYGDAQSFCPKCGTALIAVTEESTADGQGSEEKRYCAGCGTEISHGSSFCPKCGKRISKVKLNDGVISVEQYSYFLLPLLKYNTKNMQFKIQELTDVISKKTINITTIIEIIICVLGGPILLLAGETVWGLIFIAFAAVTFLMRKKRTLYMYTSNAYIELPNEVDNYNMDTILKYIAVYNSSCIKLERNID